LTSAPKNRRCWIGSRELHLIDDRLLTHLADFRHFAVQHLQLFHGHHVSVVPLPLQLRVIDEVRDVDQRLPFLNRPQCL
jgi:hypothetical protein